jgi:hypothetical protein
MREAIVGQMVKRICRDQFASKMLIKMMKDLKRRPAQTAEKIRTGSPQQTRGDKGVVEQIREAQQQEIRRHRRGEPGPRDDFFASVVSRSGSWFSNRYGLTARLD